jgi:hypothetical protein
MKSLLLSTLFLAAVATSCNRGGPESAANSIQQIPQPIVAIVPIFDRTANSDVSWNLSDELTVGLNRKLAQKSKLYLADEKKMKLLARKFTSQNDPFSNDLSWVTRLYHGNEFVVFMELLEHREVPVSQTANLNSPADLNISLKVRVVDIRAEKPRIVLQEILHDVHHVARQFTKANFQQIAWGQENFHVTPVAIAHTKFIKELATRVEDYILLAASR